ncbi:MAG TPA: peptidoglycan-binding domain-containing protein [Rugosimonospora sp.]|nr:peptidoglycan-binding domain-containing protein [Rugosimonospora sp.]
MTRRRRRGVRAVVGVVVVVGLAAIVAAAAIGFGGGTGPQPAAANLPPATATVTRGDLTQTEQVSGTLDYGDESTLGAKGGGGTITWLPASGAVVTRGKSVYKVDNHPVPLLYGSLPLYRSLAPGVSGDDVAEFERNLYALGYRGFTVDSDYTSATASAVKRWQSDLGLTQTGRIDPGQVVLASGAVRVATLKAAVGDQAAGPVFTYTGTVRTVTVALDVSKQDEVHKGVKATVTLPDGREVDGTVTDVGNVATTPSSNANSNSDTSPTINVTISVADQSTLGSLVSAPVDVTLVAAQDKNVLSVPVAALVALAEGGYGVQVVEGSGTRYVAVKTGMFASGRVEVSGDGVSDGMTVGMPK